ncbi:MAG: ATP-dependent helicase [Arachnia propionica]|nr:MAG: ATP-dependent helicase [Arachnia propionica]
MTDYQQVLAHAVTSIGGSQREGQLEMSAAVAQALDEASHLLVQAGTGTGKSLAYLAPAAAHAIDRDEPVVVATATLALQRQLATKDVPLISEAVAAVTGKLLRAAVLKGRTNYACLYRVRSGAAAPDQGSLISAYEIAQPTSNLGAEVLALREWAEAEADHGGLGDRDDAPPHTAAGWAQVSIPVRECSANTDCPFRGECFVEESRAVARRADLIVTNHALLAIDAMHGHTALPEHGVVVIDEAHELTSRITTTATDDLAPRGVERVAKRVVPWLDDDLAVEFLQVADRLTQTLEAAEPGRVASPDAAVAMASAEVRDVTRRVLSELTDESPESQQAAAAVKEVFDVAERIAKVAADDVVWVSDSEAVGRSLHAAPMDVSELLRAKVFGDATVVATSATLSVGGKFDTIARSIGLRLDERCDPDEEASATYAWRALDVGSPFDYSQQAILYLAADLPAPGRDGIQEPTLQEISQLVWAAGGRTLGLFASRRNAELAAAHCRSELPNLTFLCQGEAQLSLLQQRFIDEPETSLFGTLSLWQGVDVPGDTCRLVIIDKVPFPRPDDPLLQARKDAVDAAGGNGFMSVPAAHAALLLAQGAGRLIRRASDRGAVAILDPRVVTARYGSFLLASLPPMWRTKDRETVQQALWRLAGED